MRSPSKVYFGVGNNPITQMFLGKRSIAETFLDHYREFEGEKYYGTYGLGLAPEPILCVRDLDLAQHILGTYPRHEKQLQAQDTHYVNESICNDAVQIRYISI